MNPQELHGALAAKARGAQIDTEGAASASRRAAAELADTHDTIANAYLAGLSRPHLQLLEALVEPDQTAAAAASTALHAAAGLRAAAERAAAEVGARHLELQAAGAAGAFYQQGPSAATGTSAQAPHRRKAETMTAPTTPPITPSDALRAAAATVAANGWRRGSSLFGAPGIDVLTAIREAADSWQQGEEAIRRVKAYFRWHPEVAQGEGASLNDWNEYACADQNAAVAMLLAAAAPTESWSS